MSTLFDESPLMAVWCSRHQQYEYVVGGVLFEGGDCGLSDFDDDAEDWAEAEAWDHEWEDDADEEPLYAFMEADSDEDLTSAGRA